VTLLREASLDGLLMMVNNSSRVLTHLVWIPLILLLGVCNTWSHEPAPDQVTDTPSLGQPTDLPSPTSGLDPTDRWQVVTEFDQSSSYRGVPEECNEAWCRARRDQQELKEFISEGIGDPNAPLYFVLGVHTCDDKLVTDPTKFPAGTVNIRRFQNLISEYGGVVSFQVTQRWAELEREYNTGTLRWLVSQGSEIALHIHEDYLLPRYLGLPYQGPQDIEALVADQPVSVLVEALQNLKDEVEDLSGVEVTGFSGAPFIENSLEVAAQAGLHIKFGYKDPETRTIDPRLTVLNPWRPAGSANLEQLTSYDKNGDSIFVPSGAMPAHCQNVGTIPTPFNYAGLDYLTFLLKESLKHVDPDKINVFSVNFHPWDFTGDTDFQLWQEWLSQVLQPLLESGRVQWGTFGEVAELYVQWEAMNVLR
jgi:hypothetical protein